MLIKNKNMYRFHKLQTVLWTICNQRRIEFDPHLWFICLFKASGSKVNKTIILFIVIICFICHGFSPCWSFCYVIYFILLWTLSCQQFTMIGCLLKLVWSGKMTNRKSGVKELKGRQVRGAVPAVSRSLIIRLFREYISILVITSVWWHISPSKYTHFVTLGVL